MMTQRRSILAVLAAVPFAGPACVVTSPRWPEMEAVSLLVRIRQEQERWIREKGRAADLDELASKSPAIARGIVHCGEEYSLRLELDGTNWRCWATPRRIRPQARRAFYAERDGALRESNVGPAGPESPEVR